MGPKKKGKKKAAESGWFPGMGTKRKSIIEVNTRDFSIDRLV